MVEYNIDLKKCLKLGGKIVKFENGKTNSISLNRLLKKENINVEEGTDIVYIMYSDSSTIQIVFKILNIEDENSKLNCLYEAISK